MKTINLTLFSFDELSENVQKKIIERERWNVMERCMNCYASEYKASLKSFEKLTGMSVIADIVLILCLTTYCIMKTRMIVAKTFVLAICVVNYCFAISIIILCRISQKAGIIPRANM